jgi:membrane protein
LKSGKSEKRLPMSADLATQRRTAAPAVRGRAGVAKRALKNALDDHVTGFAAALAYYAFLAIPSALLIAAGIFGLVASPGDVASVVDKLGAIIPTQAQTLLRGSLERSTQRSGANITLIAVGAVLALWSLGGAMQNLMWALNEAYGREETRGFVRRRAVAFAMTLVAFLAFGLLFGVLVLGPPLSRWAASATGEPTIVHAAWWVAEWPLLVAALLLCFAAMLALGPDGGRQRAGAVTAGAATAVAIWLAGSALFAFYVSRFGSYDKTWGTLSAVVVMLTWLWLGAVALLVGAEIDAEAERGRLRNAAPDSPEG